jgi:hypothetical protein
MNNLKDYITPKSSEYYYKVMGIVTDLQTYMQANTKTNRYTKEPVNTLIYGGFIRNIIDHYYHPHDDFTPSKDVDVWMYKHAIDPAQARFSFSNDSFMRNMRQTLNELKSKYNIPSIPYSPYVDPTKFTKSYSVFRQTIDNIDFDLCAQINSSDTFASLTDFTVNNLYIDTMGNIIVRLKCEYSLDEITDHIKHKKLVKILDSPVNEFNVNQKHIDRFEQREKKMLSYGYNYS